MIDWDYERTRWWLMSDTSPDRALHAQIATLQQELTAARVALLPPLERQVQEPEEDTRVDTPVNSKDSRTASQNQPASQAAKLSDPDEDVETFRLTNPAPRGPYGTYYWVCCDPFLAIRNARPCPACHRVELTAPAAALTSRHQQIEQNEKELKSSEPHHPSRSETVSARPLEEVGILAPERSGVVPPHAQCTVSGAGESGVTPTRGSGDTPTQGRELELVVADAPEQARFSPMNWCATHNQLNLGQTCPKCEEAAAALTVCQQENERLSNESDRWERAWDAASDRALEAEAALGDLREENKRLREQVAELWNVHARAIRDELALGDLRQFVARLRAYVQHDNNCKMIRCVECNGSRGNGRHQESWTPGSGVYWHEFTSQGACTCGLAALVAEQEAK
jgi:hypothetical protein